MSASWVRLCNKDIEVLKIKSAIIVIIEIVFANKDNFFLKRLQYCIIKEA